MGSALLQPIQFPAAEWGSIPEGSWVRHIGAVVLCYWIMQFRGFCFLVVLDPLADVEAGEPLIRIEDHCFGLDTKGRLGARAQGMMLAQAHEYVRLFSGNHAFDGHSIGYAVSMLVMVTDTECQRLVESYLERYGDLFVLKVAGPEVVDG